MTSRYDDVLFLLPFLNDGGDQEILKSKAEIRGRSTVGWRRRQQSGILRIYGVICDEDAKGANSRAKTTDIQRRKLLFVLYADYSKEIWYDEDVHDLRYVETEFPAIVFNEALTSEVALSCEPTVGPLNNNQIDFRISFDESDDEDYTVIYDKNSFSYKIISVNDLKTGSENDNYKVNMPSFSSSEPTVCCFNDFDYFKDFEKEFPAIAYNDALTSKLDFFEPTISPQHIYEFDKTSLSEYDGEEQNVIYFNDLFPFKVIYPDDLSDKDNDNDKIDIEQSSRDLSIEPLPTVIKIDAQWSNKLLETNHDTTDKFFKTNTYKTALLRILPNILLLLYL
ncbi:hypothetical protein Tco_0956366 [Tanacetum coccineum]